MMNNKWNGVDTSFTRVSDPQCFMIHKKQWYYRRYRVLFLLMPMW